MMKRKLLIGLSILSLSLLFGCAQSTSNQSTDATKTQSIKIDSNKFQGKILFRNVGWGMTVDQVKEAEKLTLTQDTAGTYWSNQIQVDGKDAVVFYNFIDGKLEQSGYLFLQKHLNNTDYITDYKNIKENLTTKYGTPAKDDVIWKGDLWRDNPQQYGMAVATGELIYNANWNLNDMDLKLGLGGDNFKINLGVIYQSKDFESKNKNAKNRSSNKEF